MGKSKNEYLYEICLFESEISLSEQGLINPDIIGIFGEENLINAKEFIENNGTDLYEGCFDFITIDKVPLNTFYHRTYIVERHIYKYDEEGNYKLIGIINGENNVQFETYNVIIGALKLGDN